MAHLAHQCNQHNHQESRHWHTWLLSVAFAFRQEVIYGPAQTYYKYAQSCFTISAAVYPQVRPLDLQGFKSSLQANPAIEGGKEPSLRCVGLGACYCPFADAQHHAVPRATTKMCELSTETAYGSPSRRIAG